MKETAESIINFWFGSSHDDAQAASQQNQLWWGKDEQVDAQIRTRFESTTEALAKGELDDWAQSAHGVLAMVLLVDQFPRNMYRGTPNAFAFDPLALRWSLHALERGMDNHLSPIERVFLYLPFEHSEVLDDQNRSVLLFEQLQQQVPQALQETFAGFVDYARRHQEVIRRFGHFPHRNQILGRPSTAEEIAFLQQPGSSF